jgi:hypothetical protein
VLRELVRNASSCLKCIQLRPRLAELVGLLDRSIASDAQAQCDVLNAAVTAALARRALASRCWRGMLSCSSMFCAQAQCSVSNAAVTTALAAPSTAAAVGANASCAALLAAPLCEAQTDTGSCAAAAPYCTWATPGSTPPVPAAQQAAPQQSSVINATSGGPGVLGSCVTDWAALADALGLTAVRGCQEKHHQVGYRLRLILIVVESRYRPVSIG